MQASSGHFLLASANLLDSYFQKSVILMCEHNDEGSFGLIINRQLDVYLNEFWKNEINIEIPLYCGGPVQENTIHILHCLDTKSYGGKKIVTGVNWGGHIEKIINALDEGQVSVNDCRFFVGYSGWGEKQLANELKLDSWYIKKASKKEIFEYKDDHWKSIIQSMGTKYKLLSTFPNDPKLN
ncbi:MAG: YqgE/AlgH family protein [Lentisphaeria bacterium]|nr:YqgE/AlgH family protein [Lentisphaeria bacterium]NQZ69217.1 YqgE/AlgH family protein [Lentisphaeria bacterium]